MSMEKTLVLVKPDGVRKNLIGEIISRFEKRGLRVAALKMMHMDEALAKKHYAEHDGKPFFGELVEFITSGPIVAMAIEGENAIRAVQRGDWPAPATRAARQRRAAARRTAPRWRSNHRPTMPGPPRW